MGFLVFGILAFGVFAALCAMLNGHVPQAVRNLTSVEDGYDGPNPYDLNSWHLNLEQVFGRFGPDWLLPISPWKPVSDGVSFRRLGEKPMSGFSDAGDTDSDESEDSSDE